MKNEQELNEVEAPSTEPVEGADEGGASESEFKVTVRKLEMPVRPRGVLAE